MVLQNTNLNIRVPKRLKDKFIQITKDKELNYSMVIRSMIRDYVANDGNLTQLYNTTNAHSTGIE